MLLSVLIPSLFRFDQLKQSILSWHQSGPGEFEVLVRLHLSDQESCDRWQELRGGWPLKVLFSRDKLPKEGNAFLWSEMIPLAHGEWIQFWSDDMTIEGPWVMGLKLCERWKVQHPEVHQLNGSVYVRDSDGPTPFVPEMICPASLSEVPDKTFFNAPHNFLPGVTVKHTRKIDRTLPAHEY